MIKSILTLCVIPFGSICLLLTSCGADEGGNDALTVHNDTNRTIRVYYTNQSSSSTDDSNPSSVSNSTPNNETENIGAGSSKEIDASDNLFSSDLTIVYGGIVQTFTVNVDFWGNGDLHVSQSDFYTP